MLIIILFNAGSNKSYSDNHNIIQILEALQQDLKTLERAVYSESFEKKNIDNNNEEGTLAGNNSEEALTRHLLKLSEIENQFRDCLLYTSDAADE